MWRIFEMRNLTTMLMLRGQVVHTVVADALQSVKTGQRIDARIAKQRITDVIRARYMESAKRLWHFDNRPPGRKQSEITSLIEHYYQFPGIHERARESQIIAWKCVENLINSDYWAGIVQSDTNDWREIDGETFPTFDLDGIQIYAKPDFAHTCGSPTIVDWKTGSPSRQDPKQLMLYSLYAKWKWNWNPLETKLAAVYLQPDFRIEEFTPSAKDIETVKNEVKESFKAMTDIEPTFGPANVDDFPMTENKSECTWCRFQRICKMLEEREQNKL